MSEDLLRPPSHLSPSTALRLSQQAPSFLQRYSWNLPWPLTYLASDDPEKWIMYENLFASCLRTGDNKSAKACLQKLEDRFGVGNEKVMGMVGLYHEAIAPHEEALARIMKSYEEEIADRPTNMVIRKRHAALLKSTGKIDGAVAALCDLVDASPTDAEAWAELAELYFTQGMIGQAIYSLEEVLLVMPNAWNIHARLGEFIYVQSVNSTEKDAFKIKGFARAMKSFCRAIELCDDYLRGFYGLKLATTTLLRLMSSPSSAVTSKDSADEDFVIPSTATVKRLNELATAKLAEIIRKHSLKAKGWNGYEESEIIAARELLDRDNAAVIR